MSVFYIMIEFPDFDFDIGNFIEKIEFLIFVIFNIYNKYHNNGERKRMVNGP